MISAFLRLAKMLDLAIERVLCCGTTEPCFNRLEVYLI